MQKPARVFDREWEWGELNVTRDVFSGLSASFGQDRPDEVRAAPHANLALSGNTFGAPNRGSISGIMK
jgi:hypothetical protein